MININKIIITSQQVIKSDEVIITDVRDQKGLVNGSSIDRTIGFNYTVVCPLNRYETFSIKIEQEQPVITKEQLEAKRGTVRAKVKGFEGKFYQNKNKDVLFSARAKSIEVIL